IMNDSIQWVDLTYTDGPMTDSATACIGGKNNDMIFIFGGITPLGVSQAFVNQFDTNKQQWINITSVDSTPTNRSLISCANFDNGLIAIFDGISNTSNITNDLWIFNALTLTWSLRNATNAPLPMFGYCAVTLPDGNILYLGGINFTPSTTIPMNNSISCPTPSGRRSFSAVLSMQFTISVNVLTSDGRIIIFGGSNAAGTVLGDLWILDITMFQWLIGKILNPIVNLTLKDHTATLVNNYMFVSFGRFGNYSESSRIFMLDVSQKDFYKWVTEFTPNTTTTTTFTATTIPTTTTTVTTNSNNTSSDSKNTSIIIGAIIGSIISLIIFVIASILTLKFIDKQM
ncbi:10272_t:CDS:2, partial [Gigaspora margarita]